MDEDSRRSTRRVESSAKQKQKDALRLMQEARRSGKAYKPNLDDLHEDLYKEVNEDEYNEIVRQRQNDFVIDDDGAGYVDHGADIFDDDYEDDDYGDVKENKKKKKKKEDKPKKGAINSFFSAAPAPKAKVDESQVKLDEDDLLKDTLALLADECLEPDFEAPVVQNHVENSNPFRVKRPAEQVEDEMAPRPISKRVRLTTTDPVRRPPKVELTPKKLDSPAKIEKAVPMDDDDDFDDGFESPAFTTENEEPAIETKMEVEEPVVVEKKIKISEANWNYEEEPAVNISVQAGQEAFYIKENEQQMIRMYWLDAYEDNIKHPGTIYLFGRVFIKDIVSASCAVVVTNVERQVFFLPKDMSDDQDVYEEIKTCLERIRVSTFKCRKVQKKFMNDGTLGEGDHEKELDVFEIRYDSKHPVLSRDLTGKHFQSIFNTTTTALERILVEQGMMGPGWLDITNYTPVTAQRTYCDYEFTVDMERMKNIAYNTTEQRLPPLAKMVALNVVTSLNGTEKEICMVSALYNPKCALTNPSTERKHLQRFCVLTKTASVSLPFNLESQFKSLGLRAVDEVKIMPNETKLLYVLLAKLAKWEPDIIVGHDLGALIDLLKDRLKKHNVNGWDKICRLRRTAKIGTVKESKAGHWELTAGRLLLDSRLLAMELVRSRSFDLTELASLLLNVERKEIYANEISSFYGRSDRTIDLINWSWEDPYIALRIIAHLNALPLALQITNIVGGVTSRTLMGGRAERNEYLLLHAFHKSNIIAPNKYQSKFKEMKNKPAKKEDDCEAGNEEHAAEETTSKNKAQYAGGLVLEPKKGLYDTLILLLDFNSLYPSIIQEFNICFTTVQHTKDSNDLPEVPSSGLPEGVLPKEIRGLVERRRQVKSLMKDKNISESKKKQYDIRQMALKLTANSMYGCLGFQQSRFYAKPLAALITAKGREILMHSKELVEKMGYTVVYGDTDSIMINTNSTDLAQAKKLGFEIKRAVNQCHRLLELDLDGVFKRMLLLKKKKYAALTVNPDDEKDMKKELKGLDIVRRDWSLLAKQSGTEIVDLILNPALSREELVSEIVDSLKMLRKKLDEGEIDTKMFEISKQLTRNVKEYKDLKSQPHASVAMRLNESGKFALKQGDIVEYVICEDGTTNPATQRAYHKTELADRKDLKIDLHYYLAQQVHPVVSRLCAPIEETDAVLIAESLGLDSTSYRRSALAAAAHEASEENELGYAGPVTYDHCESLHFPCPQCQTAVRIRSCTDGEEGNLRFSLEKCEKCEFVLYSCDNVIANLIRNSMMEYVEKHHTAIWRCDEAVCGYETASHLVRWNREGMECPKCSGGILRKSYTDKDLFDQQNFFRICVDIDKALKQVKPDDRRQLMQRPGYTHIRKLYLKLLDVVDEYLTHNSYNRVDLAYLFAPMLKI